MDVVFAPPPPPPPPPPPLPSSNPQLWAGSKKSRPSHQSHEADFDFSSSILQDPYEAHDGNLVDSDDLEDEMFQSRAEPENMVNLSYPPRLQRLSINGNGLNNAAPEASRDRSMPETPIHSNITHNHARDTDNKAKPSIIEKLPSPSTMTTTSYSSNPVMALLVGNPPPPPLSPPPNKTPQKRRSKTPKNGRGNPDIIGHTISLISPANRSDPIDYDPEDKEHVQIEGIMPNDTMSCITNITKEERKDKSADFQDFLIEERLRALRERKDDMSSDPPTGELQTGRRSVIATPRAYVNRVEKDTRKKRNNVVSEANSGNVLDRPTRVSAVSEDESPVMVVAINNQGTQNTRQSSAFKAPLSVAVNGTGGESNGQSESNLNEISPVPSPSEIHLTKTSVATIQPTVEMKKDVEHFHPHSSPSLHKSTAKKYRSKTPEKLRRINGKITSSPAPSRKNGSSGNRSNGEILKPHTSEKIDQPGSMNKKGFFRKFFGGKKSSNNKGKDSDRSANIDSSWGSHSAQPSTCTTSVVPTSSRQQKSHSLKLAQSSSSEQPTTGPEPTIVKLQSHEETDFFGKLNFQQDFSAGQFASLADDDHHDIYFGNDEVSTLSLPTVDSFQPFGQSEQQKVLPSNRRFRSPTNGSSKNNPDNTYPERRREEHSIQSLSTSDPMGSYWNKEFNGNTETYNSSNSTTLSSDHFSTPFFLRDEVATSKTTVASHANNHQGSIVDRINKGDNHAPQNAHDPFGQSPMHVRLSNSAKKNQQRVRSSPALPQDPPSSAHQNSRALTLDNPIGESLHQSVNVTSFGHEISAAAPDPPLFLEYDSVDDSSSSDEECIIDMNIEFDEEEKKDEDVIWAVSNKKESAISDPKMQPVFANNNVSTPNPSRSSKRNMTRSPGNMTPKAQNTRRPFFGEDAPSSLPTKASSSTKTKVKTGGPPAKEANDRQAIRSQKENLKVLVQTESLPTKVVRHASAVLLSHDATNELNSAGTNVASVVSRRQRRDRLLQRHELDAEDLHDIGDETGPIDSDKVIEELNALSEGREMNIASSKERKQLKMSTAARLNAKTMSYIHTLSGEPSPRQMWTKPVDYDDDNNASNLEESAQFYSEKNVVGNASSLKKEKSSVSPSSPTKFLRNRRIKLSLKTSPQASDASSESSFSPASAQEADSQRMPCPDKPHGRRMNKNLVVDANNDDHAAQRIARGVTSNSSKMFSAYNPKYKGRKPIAESKKVRLASPSIQADFTFVTGVPKHLQLVSPRPTLKDNIRVTSQAFHRGVTILRQKRELNIAMGKDRPVRRPKKLQKRKLQSDSSTRIDEPRDPIQRAGRRLLSKAAVPIQAGARQFLARREAVDRMWGILELQSYIRRWKAEAALVAYREATIRIQKVFRGYRLRGAIRLRSQAAVTIQKIVRGFLISVMTYDIVYRIITVQARVRGFVARSSTRRKIAETKALQENIAALKVQAWWRCRSINGHFRYLLLDTIMTQSMIRKWHACRKVSNLREERRYFAATTIQKTWRCFQAYTDYIFCVVDILVCQRTARMWIARKEALARRSHKSAHKIQSTWMLYQARQTFHSLRQQRSALRIQTTWRQHLAYESFLPQISALIIQKTWRQYSAYKSFIISLVYILIIQRTVRIWRARKELDRLKDCAIETASALKIQRQYRSYFCRATSTHKQQQEQSAVTIQKQWRCYCAQMIILHCLVRIIVVQSVARRFLARKAVERKLLFSQVAKIQQAWRRHNLRVSRVATKIQSSWRRYRASSDLLGLKTVHVAAVKIQSLWRRFWDFSHFVILQYEIIRIQARVRGKLAVAQYNLQVGCCILIQSAARSLLARKTFYTRKKLHLMNSKDGQGRRALWAVQRLQLSWRAVLDKKRYPRATELTRSVLAAEMRERMSARRIQFWWRIVMVCRREKKAALVIERFFVMIKREIEREIIRREKRRSTRGRQRRGKKNDDSDDYFLERVWSNTVDGSYTDAFSTCASTRSIAPPSGNAAPHLHLGASPVYGLKSNNERSPRSRREDKRNVIHRASSPTMNLVMRHEHDESYHGPDGLFHVEEESSIVSGLTFTTTATQHHRIEHAKAAPSKDDGRLQSYSPEVSRYSDRSRHASAADKYMKMYGIKSVGSRVARSHHFFADDLESLPSTVLPVTPGRTPSSSHNATGVLSSHRTGPKSRELTLDVLRSPAEAVRTPSSGVGQYNPGPSGSGQYHLGSSGGGQYNPGSTEKEIDSRTSSGVGRRNTRSHNMSNSPNEARRNAGVASNSPHEASQRAIDSRVSQGQRIGHSSQVRSSEMQAAYPTRKLSSTTPSPSRKLSSSTQSKYSNELLYRGMRSTGSMQYSMSEDLSETQTAWGLSSSSPSQSMQSMSPMYTANHSRSSSRTNQLGTLRSRSVLSSVQRNSPGTPEQRSRSAIPVRMSEPRHEQIRMESTMIPARGSRTDPRFDHKRSDSSPSNATVASAHRRTSVSTREEVLKSYHEAYSKRRGDEYHDGRGQYGMI